MKDGKNQGTFEYNVLRQRKKYHNSVYVHFDPTTRFMYKIHNIKDYLSTFFRCPNKGFGCFYATGLKADLEKHIPTCVDPKILREKCTSKSVEFALIHENKTRM